MQWNGDWKDVVILLLIAEHLWAGWTGTAWWSPRKREVNDAELGNTRNIKDIRKDLEWENQS